MGKLGAESGPHRPRDDRPADRRMSMPMHRMGSRETLAELPFFGAERFGERPAQRFKPGTAWQDLTYAGLLDVIREIVLGIVALGVQPGDRVCVLSDTRPEWVQAEFGIAAAGAVVVPIYPSSPPEECEWVIGDSGAVAVICENAAQLAKVEPVRDRLPELRHVLVIDPVDGKATTLEELRSLARDGDSAEVARRTAEVRPDDPALIIYTSGTTGRPKGCVLTHRNMTASCRVTEELEILGPDDVTYLFLPLPRIFEKVYTAFASQGPPGTLAGMATGEEGRRPVGESRPDASRGA